MDPVAPAAPSRLMVAVADGVRLHVRHWPAEPGRTAASGQQVPFLLVHGLSSNARLWDGVARRLGAAGHAAYAVDLRSHGESDRPEAGYDTSTAAADVAAVSAALDLPPAVVAGQSWGGNIAVAVAARHPERVCAVALVDGGWIDLHARFNSWHECAAALRPDDLDGLRTEALADSIRGAHPDWAPWAVDATLANFRTGDGGRLARRLPIPEHLRILRSMWEDPPAPLFGAVRAPALLLPASDDATDREQVRRAAGAIPAATVRGYSGADHDLHAQYPERVAADLLQLAVDAAGVP